MYYNFIFSLYFDFSVSVSGHMVLTGDCGGFISPLVWSVSYTADSVVLGVVVNASGAEGLVFKIHFL